MMTTVSTVSKQEASENLLEKLGHGTSNCAVIAMFPMSLYPQEHIPSPPGLL